LVADTIQEPGWLLQYAIVVRDGAGYPQSCPKPLKRLPLYDGSWGGPIDEWPLLYKKCIEFLQSLLSELHGVKFLKHAQLIHTQIDSLQKEAKREEEEQIYRNLKRQWMIG
jgi:hypothetical protein